MYVVLASIPCPFLEKGTSVTTYPREGEETFKKKDI
jgi:hypothetical protein